MKLTVEHRAAPAPDPLFLKLLKDPLHLALSEQGQEPELSLDDRILDATDQAPQPLTRTELRAFLRVNNQRLGNSLAQLETLGRIARNDKGGFANPATRLPGRLHMESGRLTQENAGELPIPIAQYSSDRDLASPIISLLSL